MLTDGKVMGRLSDRTVVLYEISWELYKEEGEWR